MDESSSHPPVPPAAAAAGLPQFDPTESPAPAERALSAGLRYLHVRAADTREDAWLAMLRVQTLLDLLLAKGIISPAELQEQMRETGPAVRDQFEQDRLAPIIDTTPDKYAVTSPDIDCAALIPICKARCCRLKLALAAQDLDEGVVRWDYAHPYLMAQRADGYCTHCQADSGACGVYAQRPAVCRTYDCRDDPRIWQDFARRIPAPWEAIEADRIARRRRP